jgi:hypothetical protein
MEGPGKVRHSDRVTTATNILKGHVGLDLNALIGSTSWLGADSACPLTANTLSYLKERGRATPGKYVMITPVGDCCAGRGTSHPTSTTIVVAGAAQGIGKCATGWCAPSGRALGGLAWRAD